MNRLLFVLSVILSVVAFAVRPANLMEQSSSEQSLSETLIKETTPLQCNCIGAVAPKKLVESIERILGNSASNEMEEA